MTILVTGGGGYIGSHMAHELADAGEAVVVVDDLSTGFRSALPKTVPLVVGNIGNGELITEVIRTHEVTAIIHFAASIVVPDSVRDPLGYYRNRHHERTHAARSRGQGWRRHYSHPETEVAQGGAQSFATAMAFDCSSAYVAQHHPPSDC